MALKTNQPGDQKWFSGWFVRRIFFLFISLFLASTVIFILLRLLPGDPANALLSAESTPEQIKEAQRIVGSDIPLFNQFLHWLREIATLNLGISPISDLDVRAEITSRLAITIPLTLISFGLALVIAIPSGFIAAYKSHRWYGALVNNISQLGIAVPVFWIGIIFVYIFALKFGILPPGGFPDTGWSNLGEVGKSLLLPVLTISLVMSASLIRYVRSATLDVINSDYIRTARSLGATFSQAMFRHGIRNAAAPVISVLGIELATTFVGAVVVESVFALPGLGSLLVKAISEHDYPMIQGVLFVSTLIVLLTGFLADLAQRLVDPRLAQKTTRTI